MIKGTLATTWAALLLAGVLAIAGCGKAPISNASSDSGSASSLAISSSSAPAVSATMADYLHEHYSSFDTFNEGIQSGKSVPESLRLYAPGDFDGYVYDNDAIVDAWNKLCAVQVDLGTSSPKTTEAGVFVFDFDSGQEVIPFTFFTDKYTDSGKGELYLVQNPDEVRKLYDHIAELAKANLPKAGEKLVERNGAYMWDANGDGMLEHMWIDVIHNGDEASGGYTVRLFGGSLDASGYLDETYKIEDVELQEDKDGPYVVLNTSIGQHTVRLVGDELVVK